VLVKSGYDIVKKGDIADRVQEGILFAGDVQERSEVFHRYQQHPWPQCGKYYLEQVVKLVGCIARAPTGHLHIRMIEYRV